MWLVLWPWEGGALPRVCFHSHPWPSFRAWCTAGACWVFSVLNSVRGALIALTGLTVEPPRLSPQQILDCTGPSDTCDGGYPQDVLEYLADPSFPGLVLETEYNYTAVQGTCRFPAQVSWGGACSSVQPGGVASRPPEFNEPAKWGRQARSLPLSLLSQLGCKRRHAFCCPLPCSTLLQTTMQRSLRAARDQRVRANRLLAVVSASLGVKIAAFEQTPYGGGPLGLMLAVQHQPVVVILKASLSFRAYTGVSGGHCRCQELRPPAWIHREMCAPRCAVVHVTWDFHTSPTSRCVLAPCAVKGRGIESMEAGPRGPLA